MMRLRNKASPLPVKLLIPPRIRPLEESWRKYLRRVSLQLMVSITMKMTWYLS
jgi:hypothetical protein